MSKLQRMLCVSAVGAALALAASAAEFEGFLMDNMCSAKVEKEGVKAAKMHTRDCALMGPCKESGYALVTDAGKVIKLDAAGNEQAVKALEASKKKDNIRVRVSGEESGGTLRVASLKIL
ncbi:MAG TPA: hypothetical protein VNJ11_16725 [Bryobacteraceae bacterium]|nr:hypothetical protein [Bryobacteraceae bacterium]